MNRALSVVSSVVVFIGWVEIVVSNGFSEIIKDLECRVFWVDVLEREVVDADRPLRVAVVDVH